MRKEVTSHLVRVGSLAVLLCAFFSAAAAQQLDIASFGANCDGGDDSAAVQAALDALPDGGTLVVSCQAGIGARGISIEHKNNVSVRGINGGGFRALARTEQGIPGFGSIMFIIQSCEHCSVRDLVIEANNAGVAALGLDRCTETTVSGNTINDAGPPPTPKGGGAQAAILGTANHRNKYVGNTINRTGGYGPGKESTRGIWLGNASERTYEWLPLVANNTIRMTAHTGIALHSVAATVTGNLVEGMGDGAALKLVPAEGKSGITRIKNNRFQNSRAVTQGIQLADANTDGIIIQNNILRGVADSGIYGDGSNVQVIGNTFEQNKIAGMTLMNSRDWVIQGNVFDHDPAKGPRPGAGIRLTSMPGAIRNIGIYSNIIEDNAHGGIQLFDHGGSIDGVAIEGNVLRNSGAYGIVIDERDNGKIVNVGLGVNCYVGNASGTVKDNRSGGRALNPPTPSMSCPDAK